MRRFELVEGASAKFWEVGTRGAKLTVRYGRLGSDGQLKEKELPSPAAAVKEASKLIAEKLAKGYAEKGRKSLPKQAAPSKPARQPLPKKKIASRMAVPGLAGREGTFSFGADLDALYARGWPHLRVLSDEAVSPAVAQKTAKAALQAIDPYLPTVVPRDVARRVLRGYPFDPFKEEAAIVKAIAGDEAVDEALLQRVLSVKLSTFAQGSETYAFRIWEVLYLFEAFLGTEVVARAVIAFCRHALENLAWWGTEAFWVDHHNANVRRVVPGLGFLRLRMDPKLWASLVGPLAKGNPKLPQYSRTLRALADDASPLAEQDDVDHAQMFALQRRDQAFLRSWLETAPTRFDDAQLIWVCGADLLLDADLSQLCRDPKWMQQRTLAELGTIKAPGTVRVMGAFLGSKSVSDVAAAWLVEHARWVEKTALPVLSKRPRDSALAKAVRAVLAGEAPAPPPSRAELKKDLTALFKELPAQMKACEDDPKKERAAMSAAFERYCAINAALGEVTPEAYFTHQLALPWKATQERVTRWIDLAVDVAS